MSNVAKWRWLITGTLLLPLCGAGCSTTFHDALVSGVFDFVAGTVTEVLSQLLPIAGTVTPV